VFCCYTVGITVNTLDDLAPDLVSDEITTPLIGDIQQFSVDLKN